MNLFAKRYFFNPETLRVERVTLSRREWVRYSLVFGLGLIAFAVFLRYGFEQFSPTPRQIIYEEENTQLRSDYVALNSNLQLVESQLTDMRDRDAGFYRSILSLEPVPSSIRDAGTGGADSYGQFANIREPGLVKNVSQRMDKISSRIMIQSLSLESVYEEAISNQHFLASRPSINPISPADPFWITSSYGYRKDPFNGRRTAHHGIDLAGPLGLDIHATGDGVVVKTRVSRSGYGNEVLVDHGFGYTSRYAHLKEILVKPGQKLKRGELVGTMGSTGRSTGPHVHYEVCKNGHPVNPMYFFYENLSSEEYTLLASKASTPASSYQPQAYSQK
ncbi:MAG: M23 family metallopeptidase [Bacteroides sp.]|nr:M23 family metallopeptidase [Bacteroides sp.]